MRRRYLLLLIPLFLGGISLAHGQTTESPSFPQSGASAHLGSSYLYSIISLSQERYRHSEDGKHHYGVGYGLSGGWGYFGAGIGVHAMGSYWSGRGQNHFEVRLGLSPTYFFGNTLEAGGLLPIPIVLLGYRRQAPGSDRFFFINVGSVGLGVGWGTVLGKK